MLSDSARTTRRWLRPGRGCGSLAAMRRPPFAFASLALLLLAEGCRSSLPPFEATPKAAPTGVTEDFTRIGVCYNAATSTQREVLAVARAGCDPGTTPHLLERDLDLVCPLLTPVRATYACLKPGAKPPVVHR